MKKTTFLVILFIISAVTISAQVGVVETEQATILKASEKILKEVSQLRGLPARNPEKSGFKSRKELETIVIRDLDEERGPEQMAVQTKLLKLLGLIPKDYSLRDQLVKLLTEQIGGFYDPRTKEFYLVDWLDFEEQKPVIAHELTHAMQDQNFDLRRFEKLPKDESDKELAIQALIEGEATVVMLNYIFKPQGLDVTKMRIPLSGLFEMTSAENDNRFPELANAPSVIREALEFPYFYGASFVQELVHRKDWDYVSKVYTTDLPESTEQIMHPEKFFARETPTKFQLKDSSSLLGKGWKRTDLDINGEFGFYLILTDFIGKKQAKEAAEGWGGDQYAFYENEAKGGAILVQMTNWDDEDEAKEFFEAYSERTLKRYEQPQAKKDTEVLKLYQTKTGLVVLERRGKDILIIEGVQPEQLTKLQAEVWKAAGK